MIGAIRPGGEAEGIEAESTAFGFADALADALKVAYYGSEIPVTRGEDAYGVQPMPEHRGQVR